MTTTLSSLTTRVQAALMDTGAAVWDAGTLTEGIRLAVGEYGLAGEAAVTVSGLDGASETTLPALHDSLIVWGAAGYAAQARSIDRAESFELGSEGTDLKAWGDQRLKEFRAMLSFVFPGYLVTASATGGSGEDPAKLAAEVTLLAAQTSAANAQADLAGAQAAAIDARVAAEAALLTAQAAVQNAQADVAAAQAGLVGAQANAITGRLEAENALLTAQAGLQNAQASATSGQESRAAAAAEQAAADREAEAARLAGLRASTAGKPSVTWKDVTRFEYPEGYDRS